jgi:hypothetical protein
VQPVTIGRDGPNSRPGADREIRVAAQQPAVPRAQETRQAHSPAAQQSSNGWPDLFADNDLPELPQRQPASGNIGPPANQLSFPPNRIAANPATAAAAPSAETSSTSSTGAVIPASGSQPVQGRPTQATGTEQKWMPMLLVSLSLAGSLGANLFLGFSYLEARQKYASLVRKTANSFRRSASAA